MSSAQKSVRSAAHVRRRHPSRSSPRKSRGVNFDTGCLRLQELLSQLPPPCPTVQVIRSIGEGTFSKVFLVKCANESKLAVKHLVPTASPDRILMEVECLKIAQGKENVVPLLFVHRLLGDVLLAMPYVECSKFSDVVRTMDHVEARMYMRNLLKALVHIHKLGIIHRDIKPANFLYDRKKKEFKLVDFGLAQRFGEAASNGTIEAAPEPQSRHPQCKRKLTSSDLANSMESPPPSSSCSKRKRVTHPSGERGANRKVLVDKIIEDSNVKQPVKSSKETPTKNCCDKPDLDYYDRRGAILSARKRTRSATRLLRNRLSDDIDPGDDEVEEINAVPKTPNKDVEALKGTPDVRRSPRKHPSSVKTPGFSKLTISGSTIVSNDKTSSVKRQTSFTMLDPASGIPSDGTPRLQASLTSRHSTAALMIPGCNIHLSLSSATNIHQPHQSLMVPHPSLGIAPICKDATAPLTLPASGRFATPTPKRTACSCFGMPKVCAKCLSRRSQRAARAGTPGFRPPEVLMKFEHQTTAVDMWAAGVILLCILSRTYPFFRAPDDLTALAELLALFGTKAVQDAAGQYGKRLICSENVQPVDLQAFCQTLAERRPAEERTRDTSLCLATDLAVDLLTKILALSAHERLPAEQALNHPFFED